VKGYHFDHLLFMRVTCFEFQNLKESLLEFFAIALGDAWTPVASAAWKKLLTIMMDKIGEGLTLAE